MSEFETFMAQQMKKPEFAAAYAEAKARLDRSIERPCSEGNCVEFYDPETGLTESGWGPVGCPCEAITPADVAGESESELPPTPTTETRESAGESES